MIKEKKFRTLIVDDDKMFSKILKDMLELYGHEAIVVNDPKLIHAKLKKEQIDVLLLDRRIGDVDGIELCKEIRSSRVIDDTPIIMMSGMINLEETCFDAGANGFISKPFGMDMLFQKFTSAITGDRINPAS